MIRCLRGLVLLCTLLVLVGCSGFRQFEEAMAARGNKGCVWVQGAYGPFVGVSAVYANGGATFEECRTAR